MNKQIVKVSWILAVLIVICGLLSKFAGVNIFNVQFNINYFHAANTVLLFGILFLLLGRK